MFSWREVSLFLCTNDGLVWFERQMAYWLPTLSAPFPLAQLCCTAGNFEQYSFCLAQTKMFYPRVAYCIGRLHLLRSWKLHPAKAATKSNFTVKNASLHYNDGHIGWAEFLELALQRHNVRFLPILSWSMLFWCLLVLFTICFLLGFCRLLTLSSTAISSTPFTCVHLSSAALVHRSPSSVSKLRVSFTLCQILTFTPSRALPSSLCLYFSV